MMSIAYLGLGSNMGNRLLYLQQAITRLGILPEVSVKRLSALYETAPVGYVEQESFYNLVCEVEVAFTATELLTATRTLEQQLGRVRTIHWGPRTVDIDLLLFEQERCDTPELRLPHPRMWERAFVIVPLAELIPELPVSGSAETIRQLGQRLRQEQPIHKLGERLVI